MNTATREVTTAELSAQVDAVLSDIRRIRQDLHQHPELALDECRTATLIRATLAPLPLALRPPILGTDVVGLLEGRGAGPNVTLRADIDALPLEEQTGRPYRSTTPGRMHACGHDGHTAMLLGAARVLSALRDRFAGSVRFVFQPGEEVVAAARQLVELGALADPRPAAVLAMHGWNGHPVGQIASRPGPFLAAADFFKVRVVGRGAHASRPHESVDAILTAARIVEALNTIPARQVDPLQPAVVSVCHIEGGTNANILPESVMLEGTVRYLDPELGGKMRSWIAQTVAAVCATSGARGELDYAQPYVPTVNHAGVVEVGREVARRVLGAEGWMDVPVPAMGAEDFAFYIREHPGAMFRLGLGPDAAPLHSPHFDFNDDALRSGILFLCAAALEILAHPERVA